MLKSKLSIETTSLLEAFQAPVMVLDKRGNIKYLNQEADSLFDVQIDGQMDNSLQEEFKEIANLVATKKVGMRTVRYQRDSFDEVLVQVKYSSIKADEILLTLRDVSKEAKLIREYSTTKKELDAKEILQDQKDRELEALRGTIQSIFDNNPDDLLIINLDKSIREFSSKNSLIEENNSIKACHEFLGLKVPCEDCPLSGSFLGMKQKLVGHNLQDRYIQETITPFIDGKGALISFQDATKKVVLIEKIREQRETIRIKNSLLEDLLELMLAMQHNVSIDDIADHFLNAVIKRSNADSGVLFLKWGRKGTKPIKTHKNIAPAVIESLVEGFLRLPVRDQDIKKINIENLPAPKYQWQRTDIIGPNDENVGVLIIDLESSEEKKQTLTLFSQPMGAFIAHRKLTQQLETLAHHDGLTDLYNRHYLIKVIKEEEEKFQTYTIPFALLLGDANGLKLINDTYGHEAGDAYLIKMAECIKKTGRNIDVVARIGGDEFCALLANTTTEGGEHFVARLRKTCAEQYIEVDKNKKVPISMSIGIVNRIDVEESEMLKVADGRMYEDKQNYYAAHEDAVKR